MYLFARTSVANPDRGFDAMTFAVEVAAQVTSITGVEVSAWSALYGAPINALSWTARVESHAEMAAVGEKLAADAAYMERIQSSSELFLSAPEDIFSEVLAVAGDVGPSAEIASIVTAQCAPGRIGAAMGWGLEIFNHVASVTGRPGLMTRPVYGSWGTIGWISLADSMDQVDAANAATAADPNYLEMVDGGAENFLPGSGQSRLVRRIG